VDQNPDFLEKLEEKSDLKSSYQEKKSMFKPRIHLSETDINQAITDIALIKQFIIDRNFDKAIEKYNDSIPVQTVDYS